MACIDAVYAGLLTAKMVRERTGISFTQISFTDGKILFNSVSSTKRTLEKRLRVDNGYLCDWIDTQLQLAYFLTKIPRQVSPELGNTIRNGKMPISC